MLALPEAHAEQYSSHVELLLRPLEPMLCRCRADKSGHVCNAFVQCVCFFWLCRVLVKGWCIGGVSVTV